MSVRGKWQLKGVLLRYCKVGGSSRGVREFLAGDLVEFARANPHIAVRVQQLANRHPVVFGEYVDGTVKDVGLKNQPPEVIGTVLSQLRSISTATVRDLSTPVVSSNPSIQGPWDPSTTFDTFQLREGRTLVKEWKIVRAAESEEKGLA